MPDSQSSPQFNTSNRFASSILSPNQTLTNHHKTQQSEAPTQAHNLADRRVETEEASKHYQDVAAVDNAVSSAGISGRKDIVVNTLQSNPPEVISAPETGLVGKRTSSLRNKPHSRPKKRCTRHLRHPSRQRRQRLQPQRPPPATNLTNTLNGQENSASKTGANKEAASTLSEPYCKAPTSRPKRKCRFGPRARRVYGQTHDNVTTLRVPHKHQGREEVCTSRKEASIVAPPEKPAISPPNRAPRHSDSDDPRNPCDTRKPESNVSQHAVNLGTSATESEDEINELLQEIDATRRAALHSPDRGTENSDKPTHDGKSYGSGDPSSEHPHRVSGDVLIGHTGRPRLTQGVSDNAATISTQTRRQGKEKCHFGPRAQRGRESKRTFPSPRCDPPPSPPPRRTSRECDGKADLAHPSKVVSEDQIRQDSSHQGSCYEQEPPIDGDPVIVLPDRPTICHFASARCSPFARYLGLPEVTTRPPPPFRSIPERLGISEEDFEAKLVSEIDEALLEFEEERRRSSEVEPPLLPPPLDPHVPLVPLTKEDCLAYFRRNGYPNASSPGSLWGMYHWAANLGRAKFFPDVAFDEEGLSILNAYY